jgi:hypothetical protein
MKFLDIIRNNKIYTVLFIFILLVNLTALIAANPGKKEAPGEIEQEAPGRMKTVLTPEQIEQQRGKLNTLMKTKPLLYGFIMIFQLLIFFIIILGFGFDGYFITRWLKKKPPDINLIRKPEAVWTTGDVLRVILIFLSCGYVFAIFQVPFVKYIPILKNQNFNMIFNTGIVNIGAIAVIFFFVTKKYGQGVNALGLSSRKIPQSVFIGITGYITAIPVIFIIMLLTFLVVKLIGYEPPVQPVVEVFMKEERTSVLGVSVLFAAICGPIAEEIFFRGFMYSAVKKKTGIPGAILITSALFSGLHTHIVGFMPIMALGVLLAYLYEKTGSIIPSITVHVIHNVGTVFMVFIAKYLNT